MKVVGIGTETFYYLNGIIIDAPLQLADGVELMPASCSPDPDENPCSNECETHSNFELRHDLSLYLLILRNYATPIFYHREAIKENIFPVIKIKN